MSKNSTIGRISTVKRSGVGDQKSLRSALNTLGYSRFPGTAVTIMPYKDPYDGTYRTGLDENASYILRMPAELQETERARVRGLREMADKFFSGVDLGPRSDFYANCIKELGKDSAIVCPIAYLKDGDNLFDLTRGNELITFAYLRVHPFVAPSGSALMYGQYSKCLYYVNDFDIESAVEYKAKAKIAEAFFALKELTPTRKKMVARQLGFIISDEATEESVYNKLYDYIEESKKPTKSVNLTMFNKFATMDEIDIEVRDLVKQGLQNGVFRKQGGAYFRGEEKLAYSEEELVNFLVNPVNSDQLISAREELKMKKTLA